MDLSEKRMSFYLSDGPSGSRDGRNSMVDNIKKIKEKRLKMLDEYSSDEEYEIIELLAQAHAQAQAKKRGSSNKKSDALQRTSPRKSGRIRTQVTPEPVMLNLYVAAQTAAKEKIRKILVENVKPVPTKAKPAPRKAKPAPRKAKPAPRKAKPAQRKAKPVPLASEPEPLASEPEPLASEPEPPAGEPETPPAQDEPREKHKNIYGPLPGIEIGHTWKTRVECSHDGVHRPTIAGIHPGPVGAYSIALSGGYKEDVDDGNIVIFTGAGGRKLKGTMEAPKNVKRNTQIEDQVLNKANLSLLRSLESGVPVRLIRGHKVGGYYAPARGYRYDGLYKVLEYCYCTGISGFNVFRFKMLRIQDQPPAPWVTSPRTDMQRPPCRIANPKYDFLLFSVNGTQLDKKIDECIKGLRLKSNLNDYDEELGLYRCFTGWQTSFFTRKRENSFPLDSGYKWLDRFSFN